MNIMKNYRLITLVVFITHYALCIANTPAFPTAEGYGKYATGGRGGNVYYVTRLDDCSDDNLVEGTLRWALRSGDDTPRTVLFQVCGTIYLNTKLKLAHPNITIAGQTAPGGGICIAGANIYICKPNIIIRHIRFRAGDIPNTNYPCLDVENTRNVILDHCSFTWSMEECLTLYDCDSTTVQWSIIGEGLYNSKHHKGQRSYATQWGGEHATMHHCLITNCVSRTPRFNGVRDEADLAHGKRNHDAQVDNEFVNNDNLYGYTDNNPNRAFNLDGATADEAHYNRYILSVPTITSGIIAEDTQVAYHAVSTGAGASLPRYDEQDLRMLGEAAGTVNPQFAGATKPQWLGIIDSQHDIRFSRMDCFYVGDSVVTGYPFLDALEGDSLALDSDLDGLPDEYELEIGLNPNNPADAAQLTDSGYSALEVYLNGVADGTIDKSRYEHIPYISKQPFLPENMGIPYIGHTSVHATYDLLGHPIAEPQSAIPYIREGGKYVFIP